MSHIYHITTQAQWNIAKETGYYASPSLKEEGFVHCSEDRQIPDVLTRYFSDKTQLVKLTIDTEKLTSQLIYDWSNAIEDTFPHIYGPVNIEAIVNAEQI